ncbi:NADH-quinone oxidoreductase subunit L [Raineyella sp. W15-4]|uniref:NADH-quinone oxidoreductase subunit L n=1 Tax=Raineyella sp. W15-4 TaxID=3081651 RepID=UPI002955C03C|nr:NADH-quinone oxidoreductase subunit L [Raineyella sp. W15-4]WOQ17689.1 NADH-quinone oxidoreductase subunit L [Raineyella sp. W15-4]
MIPLELTASVPAEGMFTWGWTMIAAPALGALLLLVLGRLTDRWGHYLATLMPIWSFAIASTLFVGLLTRPGDQRVVSAPLYEWISAGPWTASFGLRIDPLSILFALLVTGVGSLIHIYSIGYMAHDPNRRRFFAYLNLFITAMLILVLADNYLLLFMGWEGVGLSSYLLIGFWQERPSAAKAATKAFVMNRVGDVGMSIALILMIALFGSTSYDVVNAGAPQMTTPIATLLGILLLVGACAKSAQVPLQAWLLDAMEGPTPVSALIHAATMVTAGVYLVVRSGSIYAMSEAASTVVVIVGTVTLLAGAWIGSAKDDIKKVLAGSTMSQIGYMMLAAGIGPAGYVFAIFHLLTHGFFKANMFLGAGSIMHGMNDDVNMRHYGGLARAMRITFITFAMGYLAIIGFPFFAGFYSKDHIIEAAFEHNVIIGILALVGAGVTGFYMTRLMMMTFFGEKRWRADQHPHESPAVMWVPLVILAAMSVFGGFEFNNWIGRFLAPAVNGVPEVPGLFHFSPIAVITLLVVAAGVALGWWLYRGDIPDEAPQNVSVVTRIGRNDLYQDTINAAAFTNTGNGVVTGVVAVDDHAIDAVANGTGTAFAGVGQLFKRVQTGYVRSYALTMVAGSVLIAVVLILGRLA